MGRIPDIIKLDADTNEGREMQSTEVSYSLFEGVFNLEIPGNIEYSQLMNLRRHLSRYPEIRLVSTSGFIDGNITWMVYVIDVRRPLPLVKIFEELPEVEDINYQERDILINLK